MTHVVRCWCTWSWFLTGWWWYGGTTLQAYINIRVVGERTVRRANRLVPYHIRTTILYTTTKVRVRAMHVCTTVVYVGKKISSVWLL